MISINSDSLSLLVRRNLNSAASNLNTVLERMATGYKVNGAKDDAANLFISENLKTQINSARTLKNGASIAIDALSIAESALSDINKSLTRIRDLTLQQMNSIYDENSQKAITDEINAQIENIIQISKKTNFNGRKLLDGTANDMFIPLYDSENGVSGLNIGELFEEFDFIDVLSGKKDIYFLTAKAGETYYADFDGKLFPLTSDKDQQIIYNYNKGNISFIDTSGAQAVELGSYDNCYNSLGNGEQYVQIEANKSCYIKSGNKVYELKNTNSVSQVAIFKNNDAGSVDIVSGEGIQKNFLYDIDGHKNINSGQALELKAGSEQHLIFNNKLYKITSEKNQTLIFNNKNGNLNQLAGTDGVSVSFVANMKIGVTTGLANYIELNPNETKYYEYDGVIYKITNNASSKQNFITDSNNNIKDNNGSIVRTKLATGNIKDFDSYLNPQYMNVKAGEVYYIKRPDGRGLTQITAKENGQIFFDLKNNGLSSLKGASVSYSKLNMDYEDVSLDFSNRFELEVEANSTKTITIGDEIYTITNDSNFDFVKTFEYDSSSKSVTEADNHSLFPSINKISGVYIGDTAPTTGVNRNNTRYMNVVSGTSYVKSGDDIYEINNNGTTGDFLFNYNPLTGEIAPADSADIQVKKLNSADFGFLNTQNFSSIMNAGETQYMMFTINGVQRTYKVTNNSDSKQSVIFDKKNNLTVKSGENIQIEEYTDMSKPSSIGSNSFYVDFNGETKKNIYVNGHFYELTNPNGTTAIFRPNGSDIKQYAGSTTTKVARPETIGNVSKNTQYSIELNPNEVKYIKINDQAFKLENTTGTKQTQVFSVRNGFLENVNPNILSTNIPISNMPMQQMLIKVDWSIQEVLKRQASIGASSNILEASISRNTIVEENHTAARSTIMDADFAEEAASFVSNQILQNVSQALLAQTNFAHKTLILGLLT